MNRWTWVVAGVLPLLLGGCSGDPEPRFEAEPTPTASVSVAPSESASPAAETAEDFIRRWVEVDTAMQNSGNTDAYRDLLDGCTSCDRVVSRVNNIYGLGGYVRLEGQRVSRITRKATDGTTSVYTVQVNIQPTKYKESATSDVASYAGGPVRYEVTIREDGDSFKLTDYAEVVS